MSEHLSGNQFGLKWLPGYDVVLRRLCDEGYSAAQIACEINGQFNTTFSRNATIGRLHRLGLTSLNKSGSTKAKPSKTFIYRARVRPPLCEEVMLSHAAGDSRNLSLLELEPHDCRYPYGNGPLWNFCGHERVEGSSYCVAHFYLCTGPGTTSERRAGEGVAA